MSPYAALAAFLLALGAALSIKSTDTTRRSVVGGSFLPAAKDHPMTMLPDEERDECRAIAGGFLSLSEKIKLMQDRMDDAEPIRFLEVVRENLIDWAAILSPPGEPEDGYPKACPVYSLDAYRARKKG